jgi:predicted ATP-grasp superfamily ATP-dependent carboligase
MARVLIVGVSTRALAESAARAGHTVVAVDGFGDLDLRAAAARVVVARAGGRFSVGRALRAARALAHEAVCYAAGLENRPRAVAALAREGALWGNPPAVLARVRDPRALAAALRARGFATPRVRTLAPRGQLRGRWLLKPRASGGGSGIVFWDGGGLPHGRYLQEWLAGAPGSVLFAADGRRAVALGMSRGLAGERGFGADGFRYCGSMLLPPRGRLFRRAARLAAAVTEAFGLVGVNGIDFIAVGDEPYPVEVNPRYTAAMELVERAYRVSVFELHVRALAGVLPLAPLAAPARGILGKAIVYARRPVIVPDTRPWLADATVRDVPPPGTRIPRGAPICTVFARGSNPAACHAALCARARRLYRILETRREVA